MSEPPIPNGSIAKSSASANFTSPPPAASHEPTTARTAIDRCQVKN
ncbi:hypothetical protein QUA30_14760 [Microcoleus sp. Pol14C2]